MIQENSNFTWRRIRRRLQREASKYLFRSALVVNCPRPMVSFTFDDIYASAASVGAEILEKHGVRGTFYTSFGLTDLEDHGGRFHSLANIRDLSCAGHEIGCHTFGHLACGDISTMEFAADVKRNGAHCNNVIPKCTLENFAFPFGQAAPFGKRALLSRFCSLRGTQPGINHGIVDFGMLKANRLYQDTTRSEDILQLFEMCEKHNGWLIFYSHDVSVSPSQYGCSPALLEDTILMAISRNLNILPVRDATRRLTALDILH